MPTILMFGVRNRADMQHTNYDLLEKSLLTLDDSVFFHIIKNYLGKLETPFHKPTLLKRLFKFLSQQETKNRIISLIENRDRIILSAIHNFNSPPLSVLIDHLLQDFNYFEFHSAIQNLEERLLIFEYEDRLYINPIFYTELSRHILQTNWNINSQPFSPQNILPPWLTEVRVFGLMGWLYQKNTVYYKDSTLRKKVIEDCACRVFSLSADQSELGLYETRIQYLYRTIEKLGFAASSDAGVNVKFNRISDFVRLDLNNRLVYIWAAYISIVYSEEMWPSVQNFADIVSSVITSMPLNYGFDRKSLNYFLGMVSSDLPNKLRNLLIDGLIELDVFCEDDGVIGLSPYINLSEIHTAQAGLKPITFNAGVSFTLDAMYTPDALMLAVFTADLLSIDYIAQFEITKSSIHKGAHFFEGTLVELYKEISSGMSQSAEFTIRQWTEQLDDIELFAGVTIKVKERIRHIFEDIIEDMPVVNLGNGVYVIPGDLLSIIQSAFEHHGVLVPGITEPHRTSSLLSSRLTSFKQLSFEHMDIHAKDLSENEITPPGFIDSLYQALAKTNLSRHEREEIEGKIKGGMILFPEQISSAICRKDKVEAKGIDYQGKINLIQQALKSGLDLLSVDIFDDSFELETLLILPLRLVKESDAHLLEARNLPGESIHTYPVNQLSKVRLIRKSLYAT